MMACPSVRRKPPPFRERLMVLLMSNSGGRLKPEGLGGGISVAVTLMLLLRRPVRCTFVFDSIVSRGFMAPAQQAIRFTKQKSSPVCCFTKETIVPKKRRGRVECAAHQPSKPTPTFCVFPQQERPNTDVPFERLFLFVSTEMFYPDALRQSNGSFQPTLLLCALVSFARKQ